jgi:hypothetical protein
MLSVVRKRRGRLKQVHFKLKRQGVDMELETLILTVYVWIDDWCKQQGIGERKRRGRPSRMSESEILTLGVVGQWRIGVPWNSERGMVRYMQRYGRGWFPQMLQVSAFNYRFRQLWGQFVAMQQELGRMLSGPQMVYEVVDSVPLPAYSVAQGKKRRQRHWLWSTSLGYSKSGWYWGHRWLISVTAQGVITGWVLADATVQDRWLLQALLSGRKLGFIHLRPPTINRYIKPSRRVHVPLKPVGPVPATGAWTSRVYLADQAFNSKTWRDHWRDLYQATVICPPAANAVPSWSPALRAWLAHHRQLVETVFALLTDTFALKRLRPHSIWGFLARLSALAAAHNFAIFLNRLLHRPDLALPTLIC